MKNVTLAILAALFVSWNAAVVLAQSDKTGSGGESKRERIRRQLPPTVRPAEANDPRLRAEAERIKQRERERDLVRQEREKRRRRMMEMQQKTLAELEKKKAAQGEGPGGTGRDYQKQLSELQKQLNHEEQKHLERVAKMKRIRELATSKNATATVARVEKLIKKEQMRYDSKLQRTQMRINMIKRLEARKLEPRAPDDAKLREETRKAMERYKSMPKPKAQPAGKKETGEKPQP